MGSAKVLHLLIVIAASLWCIGILTAPLAFDTGISHLLYSVFGTVCHQVPEHSVQIGGAPLAVCTRCFSIYIGFLAAGFAGLRWSSSRRTGGQVRFLMTAALLPMLTDVLLSTTGIHGSTMLSRLMTGLWFGFLAGRLLIPMAVEGFLEILGGRTLRGYGNA